MLGELTSRQIEHVLLTELVGRIGCHARDRSYVVPVTYAYDGEAVYGHSALGMKIQMMRENPRVCFEVDHLDDMTNWRSVIAWGTFEELQGAKAEEATRFLSDRLAPFMVSATARNEHREAHPAPGPSTEVHGRPLVVFRIVLTEKSGRYESSGHPSAAVREEAALTHPPPATINPRHPFPKV